MTRDEIIEKLKQAAPIVTGVTVTGDLGYEFSAVVPDGVIFSEPGMLLSYSRGSWPPDEWEAKPKEEAKELLHHFLLAPTWSVTEWSDLSDDDLDQWLEEVSGA